MHMYMHVNTYTCTRVCIQTAYLHDELETLCASREEVGVLGHGGNKGLVALGVRWEVGHVAQEPLHDLHMTTLVCGQQWCYATVVNSLCSRITDKRLLEFTNRFTEREREREREFY